MTRAVTEEMVSIARLAMNAVPRPCGNLDLARAALEAVLAVPPPPQEVGPVVGNLVSREAVIVTLRGIRFEPEDSRAQLVNNVLGQLEFEIRTLPAASQWRTMETPYDRALEEQRWRAEEADCVRMYLDKVGVATDGPEGKLSLVGRIMRLVDNTSPSLPTERVRHVKRGSTYTVLHRGVELQLSQGLLVEGLKLVVYQGDDGKLCCRLQTEFDDGRFVPLSVEGPQS